MTAWPSPSALLQPANAPNRRLAAAAVLALLLASALCVFVAPLALPDSYSWRANAISEAAAQGLHSAWITRLGFVLFGAAVIWLAQLQRPVWARGTCWMQLGFGLAMLGTAAFSHKPWLPGVAFDPFEDFLHSVTASGMGFAFIAGVLLRLMQRPRGELVNKLFDGFALAVATAMPPLGQVWPSTAGLLQRSMFVVAYLWFAHEALAARGAVDPFGPSDRPALPAAHEGHHAG